MSSLRQLNIVSRSWNFVKDFSPFFKKRFEQLQQKNDLLLRDINNLPADLPLIDFKYYKDKGYDRNFISQLENLYGQVSIPYPSETNLGISESDSNKELVEDLAINSIKKIVSDNECALAASIFVKYNNVSPDIFAIIDKLEVMHLQPPIYCFPVSELAQLSEKFISERPAFSKEYEETLEETLFEESNSSYL